jgi:chromosome segregation ATPase
MKVSISKAAGMAGVTRATFYRHIEKKGITVEKDASGNPRIDVSELIRIYGDKVRSPEQVEKEKAEKASSAVSDRKENDTELRIEVEVLRERLRNIESERSRERDQLCAQIDSLRKSLERAEEQAGRLTALITDQRNNREDKTAQIKRMRELELQISRLQESQRKILDQVSEKSTGSLWSLIRKKAA